MFSYNMDAAKADVAKDLSPFIILYKDGRIERLIGNEIVPPSQDPKSDVLSKDVIYSKEARLSCRLYLPKGVHPNKKLPLLVYVHGGGFYVESAFSPTYHNYVNLLVAEAKVIAISVDYRRVPEHPIPIPYDDSWAALKWAASHVNGDGPEEWLNKHADLSKVFLAGDSAGGNIAHHVAMRFGQENIIGVNVAGIVLINPYFWGEERIGNEVNELERVLKGMSATWHLACPKTSGCDDPLINPTYDPNLSSLGCSKVFVAVAEKDLLRDRGLLYCETLKKSGWGGVIEIMEVKGEEHVFHLFKPATDNAVAMLKKIVSFIHGQN
ncbi:PREDICTED: probable carboxylesterase 12 [Populus euphratica]|uniref:Probable carboxylesterase 12 n=1 Tax=Populus euphratica TaxID=75702 RepID=A0AAJ6SWC6_POPEU|nr:PREDICTED: probable carboxylesterase 12 [Populus euphratica]